jgi:hypothetical protein
MGLVMVFSKSLDETLRLWRGFNANCANEANFAKNTGTFALFTLFAAFALKVC